jgi:hypothetical protein
MRKHGWQLPYHPLQVVAIAVFAALGFAFYVFFLPFVGGKTAQYVALGLYTPLVSSPPAPLLHRLNLQQEQIRLPNRPSNFCPVTTRPFLVQITSVVALYIWCAATNPGDPGICKSTTHSKLEAADNSEKLSSMLGGKDSSSWPRCSQVLCFLCLPFSCLCKGCLHSEDQRSEDNASEEGMFFCSLCEAEVGHFFSFEKGRGRPD